MVREAALEALSEETAKNVGPGITMGAGVGAPEVRALVLVGIAGVEAQKVGIATTTTTIAPIVLIQGGGSVHGVQDRDHDRLLAGMVLHTEDVATETRHPWATVVVMDADRVQAMISTRLLAGTKTEVETKAEDSEAETKTEDMEVKTVNSEEVGVTIIHGMETTVEDTEANETIGTTTSLDETTNPTEVGVVPRARCQSSQTGTNFQFRTKRAWVRFQ